MTTFSNWAYTSTATVWTPTAFDAFGGVTAWSRSTVACTFQAGGRQRLDSRGEEFVPLTTYWLEAAVGDEPKPGARMLTGNVSGSEPPDDAETVRAVVTTDDSMFAAGLPDHRVMTG